MSTVRVDILEGIATITLDRPKSLNALTRQGKNSANYCIFLVLLNYDAFATALRDIDKRDDVVVTVWQAMGSWFCAGTDVKGSSSTNVDFIGDERKAFVQAVAHSTTDCGRALYSHSKVLVAALNGPVMALLGHFDFIYSLPNAWLSLPFSFLGIVAEGGASVTFVNKMGLAKASEVLIWGKKKGAQELLECGFINEIYPAQPTESFHAAVRKHVLDDLGGLDTTSVLVMKKLIKTGLNEKNNPDAVNLRESYEQAARFASGSPSERFARIAKKEIKHKL
ncbi:hypothetical protein AMATHDRAFT_135442 [Amanita thiersii Skay4041]|uniref:Enoyl-CoA hydratase n=1 Tax=Amanita thiersii Skay4041 TaxID=703135 RepID=A0A2A9P168_9AGAR|nr:hypothetical protein AMATHDRAFT_135442 [Amanita thiersii Skay4041]